MLALLLVVGCADATAPHQIVVTCHPQVIQTPQGPWTTGQPVCEWLDLTTGQGGAGRHP